MLKNIYIYELKYWFKKPSIYIYFIIFFLIAFVIFLGTAGVFDEPLSGNEPVTFLNAPFELNSIFQYFNKFFLFLLPAIIGATIYRDYKDNSHSILYSFPIQKRDYLFGKFLSALTIVILITFSVGLAIIIAENLAIAKTSKVGPFNFLGYVQVYAVYVLPNILFYGAIVFAIVTYFRNIYAGFITVIVLFFLQNISENIFGDSVFLIALLDPFGQNTVGYVTQYWTLEERNSQLIPFFGAVLYNRLFWFALAAITFGYVYKKFSFSEHPIAAFFKNKAEKSTKRIKDKRSLIESPPTINYNFSIKQQLLNGLKLSHVDFLHIVKSWMFYIIIFFGLIAVLFAITKVTNNSKMAILPVTNVVLTIPAFFFTIMIMLLTFIYSGMLVHKDRSANMNQLVDSTPISNLSLMVSKVIAIIMMQALLLAIMMIAGISIQIFNGYFNFEIGQYLFNLFVIQFITLIIWAFASILVHTFIKNSYLGIFVLLLIWLGVSGLKEVGIKTRMLLFNFSEPMQYSDLNKYGNNLDGYFLVKSFWLVFGFTILAIAYLFWYRGLPDSFKERLYAVRQRFNSKLKLVMSILVLAFITLGFKIYIEENKSQELSSKNQNIAFKTFEKNFSKYTSITNQPKITSIDLEIELFPKTNDFTIKGNYRLINKSEKPIDTLLIKTGFDETTDFNFDSAFEVVEEDGYVQFSVLKLKKSLLPNETLTLDFNIKNKPNTLFETNSNVLNNGTFFKNDIFPRLGYFLNSQNKHPNDSISHAFNYYSKDSDYIDLKTTISTSKDQIAIAPGNLVKEWNENGRRFFQYETGHKIKNSLSFNSANYQVTTENYKGVNFKVFHYKNHTQNIDKMLEGLKASLDYNTKHFGAYQYDNARIIEFPITEGTYASVMANSIPTSEMRFIANTTNDRVDISFYTIAHELTHQWWGNQIIPADALGAVMLTESITEYISLQIYKEHYGEKAALDFLKMQRERYLRGRTREKVKEPPLMLVKGEQQYLSYGKGTMVFNALSHYLGKEKLHGVLKEFLDDYKFNEAPYPTSIELIERIKNVTSDSLQYVVKDMFETMTFYDNKITNAVIKNSKDQTYNVEVDFTISKYRNESERLTSLNDFIEIGFYDENDKLIKIEKIKISKNENNISIALNVKPSRIILDPNLLVIDKDIKDNILVF